MPWLFFLCIPFFLYAQTVRLGTITEYPPFSFHLPNTTAMHEVIEVGKESFFLQGLAWEIAKESFHSQGVNIELNIVPWKRAMQLAKKGELDIIFPAVKNKQRLKNYFFSKELSYPANQFLIYVQKTNTLKWSGLKSLDGKVIGRQAGYSYGSVWEDFIIQSSVQISEFKNIQTLFKALEVGGRIDGVVGYELSYDYYLNSNGLMHHFKKLPAFAKSESFLMGGRNARAVYFLDVFDKGVLYLKKSGQLKKIMQKWGF